jgi:hypothetical protein
MSTTYFELTFVSNEGGTEGSMPRAQAMRLLNAATNRGHILMGSSRNDWLPYVIKAVTSELDIAGLDFIYDDTIVPQSDDSGSRWLISALDATAIQYAIGGIECLLTRAASTPQMLAEIVGAGESAEEVLAGLQAYGVVKDKVLNPAGDSLEGPQSLYLLSYLACLLSLLRDAQAHSRFIVHLRIV